MKWHAHKAGHSLHMFLERIICYESLLRQFRRHARLRWIAPPGEVSGIVPYLSPRALPGATRSDAAVGAVPGPIKRKQEELCDNGWGAFASTDDPSHVAGASVAKRRCAPAPRGSVASLLGGLPPVGEQPLGLSSPSHVPRVAMCPAKVEAMKSKLEQIRSSRLAGPSAAGMQSLLI